MSTDLILVVVASTAVLNALIAVITLFHTIKIGAETEEIKHATNSMKDELVAVTRSDAKQEGITQGIASQKAEAALTALT